MIRQDRTHALRLLVAWAVLSVIGIVIAMQVHLPPGDQSHQASDQTWLLQLMTIVSTPVFVGVVLFIVYSAFAFRQKSGGALEDGPPSRGNFRIQVAWVAITAVIVLILAGLGISELGSAASGQNFSSSGQSLGTSGTVGAAASRPLQVQVIAQQWYFTYRYADYGGVESLHLVLPVDANGQKLPARYGGHGMPPRPASSSPVSVAVGKSRSLAAWSATDASARRPGTAAPGPGAWPW